MHYLYGDFTQNQISSTKTMIRKKIFLLLLIVDPNTKDKEEYKDIDVDKAFCNLQYELAGLNSILGEPQELVTIISLLQSAWTELKSESFKFSVYRKLILDAGAKVLSIKEV